MGISIFNFRPKPLASNLKVEPGAPLAPSAAGAPIGPPAPSFNPVDPAKLKADAAASIGRAAPLGVTSMDPVQAMSGIADAVGTGTLTVELPLAEGKEISGVTIPAGARAVCDVSVRDGRVDPEATKVRFEPPLDAPLGFQVKGIKLKSRDHGAEAVIAADIKNLLIDKRVGKQPMTMSKLISGLTQPGAAPSGPSKLELLGPLDDVRVSGSVTLRPNADVKLGDLSAKVAPSPPTTLSVEAHGGYMNLIGHAQLSRLSLGDLSQTEMAGELTNLSTDLSVRGKVEENGELSLKAQLAGVTAEAPTGFRMEKGDGSLGMRFGATKLSHGVIELDARFRGDGMAVPAMVSSSYGLMGNAEGKLVDGHMTLPESMGGGRATLTNGKVSGAIDFSTQKSAIGMRLENTMLMLSDVKTSTDYASLDLSRADFQGDVSMAPDAKGDETFRVEGTLSASLGYSAHGITHPVTDVDLTNVKVSGAGTFALDGEGMRFDSPEGLSVDADIGSLAGGRDARDAMVLKDAHLAGGKITHAALPSSGKGFELSATGSLAGTLDVKTPTLTAAGKVDAKNVPLTVGASGVELGGPLTLQGAVSGTLAGMSGVRTNGTVRVGSLTSDWAGNVKAHGVNVEAAARVGKTANTPAPAAGVNKSQPMPNGVVSSDDVKRLPAAKLAGITALPPAKVDNLTMLADLGARVQNGAVTLEVPCTGSMSGLDMTGRTLRLDVVVKDGLIDEAKTKATFTPPAKLGPLPVSGAYLKDGFLRPDVGWLPNPWWKVGDDLGGMLRALSEGGASSAAPPFDLTKLTVSSGPQVQLSAGAVRTPAGSVTVGERSQVSFSGKPFGPGFRLDARVDLDRTNLATDSLAMYGARGSADLSVTTTNGKIRTELTGLEAQLPETAKLAMKTSGDDGAYDGGYFTLSGPGRISGGFLALDTEMDAAGNIGDTSLAEFHAGVEAEASGRIITSYEGADVVGEVGSVRLGPGSKLTLDADGVAGDLALSQGNVALRGLQSQYGALDYVSLNGSAVLSMSPEGLELEGDAFNVDLQGHQPGGGTIEATGAGHIVYRDGSLKLSGTRGQIKARGIDYE